MMSTQATRLGMIGGDPSKPLHYSLGELARRSRVHPLEGVMLSIAACFAQNDKLRGAAELCSRLGLGIPNCGVLCGNQNFTARSC